jgi:hypothetical protein
VLAAVEEHVPLYRRASRDAHLLPAALEGNPELLSDEDLAERAGRIVARAAAERVDAALASFREMGDRGRAAAASEAVLAAAAEGRVDTLFFQPGVPLWGAYEAASGRLTSDAARQPGDDDLVDLAIVETLRHGGEVMAVGASAMPDGGPLAAILRY